MFRSIPKELAAFKINFIKITNQLIISAAALVIINPITLTEGVRLSSEVATVA